MTRSKQFDLSEPIAPDDAPTVPYGRTSSPALPECSGADISDDDLRDLLADPELGRAADIALRYRYRGHYESSQAPSRAEADRAIELIVSANRPSPPDAETVVVDPADALGELEAKIRAVNGTVERLCDRAEVLASSWQVEAALHNASVQLGMALNAIAEERKARR